MSTAEQSSEAATEASVPKAPATRFEVTTLPVADVDRAKAFYQGLGWRLDVDFKPAPKARVVQFTPPGSQASIQFGQGTTTMEPGSLQGMIVVVDDIVAARDDLISRGVDVGEPFHLGANGVEPGLDPNRTSYGSYATFSDPDGNTFLLQEVNERLPGRTWDD
jgi:catechol 2,3-dioxygenase-like lactoylglutathione lyase family enzyme